MWLAQIRTRFQQYCWFILGFCRPVKRAGRRRAGVVHGAFEPSRLSQHQKDVRGNLHHHWRQLQTSIAPWSMVNLLSNYASNYIYKSLFHFYRIPWRCRAVSDSWQPLQLRYQKEDPLRQLLRLKVIRNRAIKSWERLLGAGKCASTQCVCRVVTLPCQSPHQLRHNVIFIGAIMGKKCSSSSFFKLDFSHSLANKVADRKALIFWATEFECSCSCSCVCRSRRTTSFNRFQQPG